ncbi:uncharacterized protein LOC117102770 [Anneissia japonica]|uniref:uncharacterized protein LOC117102770 n=1 Tax=Anneissia japonica TaxID=1529436 RepID=UPI001425A433|nr:uncharacterized protein LOC117102770 [Anneissia japonica]
MFTDLDLLKENEKKQDVKPITLKEVLNIIKSSPTCKVLIEGEGGIGKSTLLRYIAHKWATDESDETFKGKILFLVNISSIDKGETILDGILKQIDLEDFHLETNLCQDPVLIKRFIRNQDNDIVLLLDGLDELKEGSTSPISLFKRQKLPKCKVLLTSRSDKKIYEFVKESSIHVKVKGFSEENITNYITKHFEYFEKPAFGDSLVEELKLYSGFKCKHEEIKSMCRNPMLLLSVCVMWEEKQHLSTDKADLFKQVFKTILNQFIDKQTNKEQKISIFRNIPQKYVELMLLLGKCMYNGLKRNQLSINKTDLEGREEMVALTLKLGFVYKDAQNLKSNFEEIFTAPHKLIVESLVGFYLCKLCQATGLESECRAKDMKGLLQPLDDNEWKIIRESENLSIAREFAIGFLGTDAGIFLSHWITNSILTYRSLMAYFEFVKIEHRSTVKETLINHMTKKNLEIMPHIHDICKSLRKCNHYIIPDIDIQNQHFIEIMQQFHNMKLGSCSEIDVNTHIILFCKEMALEEKFSVIVHILIAVPNQKQILEKISEICVNDDFKYLTDECQKLGFKYDISDLELSNTSTASCIVHLLNSAPQLEYLSCSFNSITGGIMNDAIRECCSRGVKLELKQLHISDNNLSNIDGSSLASLLVIAPTLSSLTLVDCSLSGAIINDMIRECCSKGVKLELKDIDISDNNLSNIDGSLFASLFVIAPTLSNLEMSNCSLSGAIVNDMMRECCSKKVKLELKQLDISDNNLSNINGSLFVSLLGITSNLKSLSMSNGSSSCEVCNPHYLYISGNTLINIDGPLLAALLITFKLNSLTLNNCRLLGAIMNDMMRECCSKGVKLELMQLHISDNDLSNIDGLSLASLLVIAPSLSNLEISNCSLSGTIVNDMVRECCSKEVKLELKQLDISDNNLSNIDGSSLASLLVIASTLRNLKMINCCFSGSIMNDMIRECCSKGVNLELKQLDISSNNLSNIDGSLFVSLLGIASKLECLIMKNGSSSCYVYDLDSVHISGNNLINIDGSTLAALLSTLKLNYLTLNDCNLSGAIINYMIKICCERGVKVEIKEIDISDNNLRNIDGSLFASLFVIAPILSNLKMINCSLSGTIMNDIMRECCGRGVKLELKEFVISGNNLSNIDGSLFASLLVNVPKLSNLKMRNCSLSGTIMNDIMRECCGRGVKLELKEFVISGNNLSNIDGSLFASLLVNAPTLFNLKMKNCSLSGTIMNDMMRECCERGVKLELMELDISDNNLSNIDGSLFVSLLGITSNLKSLSMSNDSSSCKVTRGPLYDNFLGYNHELHFNSNNLHKLEISGNNLLDVDISGKTLININGFLLATLLITSELKSLTLNNCSLSGAIMNDMMRECSSKGFKLELLQLNIIDNDLSNIDGSLFVSLLGIASKLQSLSMSNDSSSCKVYNLHDLCNSDNDLYDLYIRGNTLINIDGSILVALLSTIKLNKLILHNCSRSGAIMNVMVKDCCSKGVKLELRKLDINDNTLRTINCSSFVSLLEMTSKLEYLSISNGISSCEVHNLHDINISGTLIRINGSLLAALLITFKLNSLTLNNCCLSGAIMNDMMRECSSKGVKLNLKMLDISDNDLSNSDGSLFASLLVIAPTLSNLKITNCSLSGAIVNDMVRECRSKGVKLELKQLDISRKNLRNIDGSSLASLLVIAPTLCNLKMMNYIDGSLFASLLVIAPTLSNLEISNCSLSGAIVNDMMRECCGRGVKLELMELDIIGNNLSNIDGSLFLSLLGITSNLKSLSMSNGSSSCKVTGGPLYDNFHGYNHELRFNSNNLHKLEISGNTLININGFSLAALLITSKLTSLTLNNCSLSGAIMNDMMRECSSKGVKLELIQLDISDNDLSNIDGSLFVSLLEITSNLKSLSMSNDSSSCKVTGGPLYDNFLGYNHELHFNSSNLHKLEISGNTLININGLTLAALLITSKLKSLTLSNCSLSGAIMNDMMRECSSKGVKLELIQLDISDNDLSNIDGSLFVSLLEITSNLKSLSMSNDSSSCNVSREPRHNNFLRQYKHELCFNSNNLHDLEISGKNLININGFSLAALLITSKLKSPKFNNCSLSGAIMNNMMRECCSKGVKLDLKKLDISDNDLSNIDGSSLASLLVIAPTLSNLEVKNCSLSGVIVNDMMRECCHKGVKLELKEIDISDNDLSNIDGSSLASLLVIAPTLSNLKVKNCSLSGVIVNDMMRECCRKGVKLELKEIDISDNNISNIDGSLFVSLLGIASNLNFLSMSNGSLSCKVTLGSLYDNFFGYNHDLKISGNTLININGFSLAALLITSKLTSLTLHNCSLSGAIMNDMMRECCSKGVNLSGAIMNDMMRECSSKGVKLDLNKLDISDNDLSNIDGSSLASLLVIAPTLSNLKVSNCSLSGVIVNDMMRECCRKGVKLKLKEIDFSDNNISNIDGSLFVSLLGITSKLQSLSMSNGSLSCKVTGGPLYDHFLGYKHELRLNSNNLHKLEISGNTLININGLTLAALLITSKLKSLTLNNCSLSGAIMNNMMRECCSKRVKLDLKKLDISDNDLSNIDGSSLASLLVIAPTLSNLKVSNCSLSGVIVNDMMQECCRKGVKLELKEIDISDNNISNIDGSLFVSLLGIASNLNSLSMSNGSLSCKVTSGSLYNHFFGYNHELKISGNILININGSSLAALLITSKLTSLTLNNCSLSGAIMNDMMRECSSKGVNLSGAIMNNMMRECCSKGVKLDLKKLDISDNDLSNIDGSSLASLLVIAPTLSNLKVSNCSLSGVIVNDMMRECCRKGVKLKLKEIDISDNDLSNIDGSSLASLLVIAPTLRNLNINNCCLPDELRTCVKYLNDFRSACILSFTETWLSGKICDAHIEIDRFKLFRGDRTDDVGKDRGGGLIVYVNNFYCQPNNAVLKKFTPKRQNSGCVTETVLYSKGIFPYHYLDCVNTAQKTKKAALELGEILSAVEVFCPDACIIVNGDFNHGTLKAVFTKYKPLVKRLKPRKIVVKCWTPENIERFGKECDR